MAARFINANRPADLGAAWRGLAVAFPNDAAWRLVSCLAWFFTGLDRGRAVIEAQAARTLEPALWCAHLAEAHVLCEMAEMEQANQDFGAYWRLGRRRPRSVGTPVFGPALEAAQRALALHPVAALWNDLGAIHFAAGDYPAAQAAFRTALELEPRQRHAAANHAVTLAALGAVAELRDYLAREPLPVALPLSLKFAGMPARDYWRHLPEAYEERRMAVFSQAWWRALTGLMPSGREPSGRGDGHAP
ncbi:tetratricopeptide repeat protein [Nitrospirillum iridis]|uniref:Tetratricopeptide (TPR) repeat protein n=1 Tax=Nitrospirillum iridis TaxID=765888 RepID=A0A7X0EF95_9PROT|nr:tetratricopeptide repeat protein [Nitrospirillum iridis]MBB6252269.1 tetratricopeptide (TPR) repeat protein [Nitrospirillum iridis]